VKLDTIDEERVSRRYFLEGGVLTALAGAFLLEDKIGKIILELKGWLSDFNYQRRVRFINVSYERAMKAGVAGMLGMVEGDTLTLEGYSYRTNQETVDVYVNQKPRRQLAYPIRNTEERILYDKLTGLFQTNNSKDNRLALH